MSRLTIFKNEGKTKTSDNQSGKNLLLAGLIYENIKGSSSDGWKIMPDGNINL